MPGTTGSFLTRAYHFHLRLIASSLRKNDTVGKYRIPVSSRRFCTKIRILFASSVTSWYGYSTPTTRILVMQRTVAQRAKALCQYKARLLDENATPPFLRVSVTL